MLVASVRSGTKWIVLALSSLSQGIEACSYVSCCMVSCPFSSLTDRNMDQVPGITNLPSTGILCMIDAALTSMLLNKYRLSPGRDGVRLSFVAIELFTPVMYNFSCSESLSAAIVLTNQ